VRPNEKPSGGVPAASASKLQVRALAAPEADALADGDDAAGGTGGCAGVVDAGVATELSCARHAKSPDETRSATIAKRRFVMPRETCLSQLNECIEAL
jgi:hypothetical protein